MSREGIRGVELRLHLFLTLGAVIVGFRLRPLYPGERAAGTRLIGG